MLELVEEADIWALLRVAKDEVVLIVRPTPPASGLVPLSLCGMGGRQCSDREILGLALGGRSIFSLSIVSFKS